MKRILHRVFKIAFVLLSASAFAGVQPNAALNQLSQVARRAIDKQVYRPMTDVALVNTTSTQNQNSQPINNAAGSFELDLASLCDEQIELRSDQLKIVAFLPSDSDYEGMLELAFEQYFDPHLVRVILIKPPTDTVSDEPAELAAKAFSKPRPTLPDEMPNAGNNALNMQLARRELVLPHWTKQSVQSNCTFREAESAKLQIATLLNRQMPMPENAPATVVLLDQNNQMQWRDDDYRAQGEHLKPLERKIKALLNQPDPIAQFDQPPAQLKVGDRAPNFAIDDERQLSDLRGKAVLITFYPAAFSGTLDTRMCSMCCAVQISALSHSEGVSEFSSANRFNSETDNQEGDDASDKGPVRIAISASTPERLVLWKQTLRANAMLMVNDADYRIAQTYNSFDAGKGYNRRTVFIVDGEGIITHIEADYGKEDLASVQAALKRARQMR